MSTKARGGWCRRLKAGVCFCLLRHPELDPGSRFSASLSGTPDQVRGDETGNGPFQIQTASPPRFGRVLDLAGRLPVWRRAKGRPFVRRSYGTARLLKGHATRARVYHTWKKLWERKRM